MSFSRVWIFALVSSTIWAAKPRRVEPNPSESLDVDLPREWHAQTQVDPLAPRPEAEPRLEVWLSGYSNLTLTADPSPEPRYTAGGFHGLGASALYRLAAWPQWVRARAGLTLGWRDRTSSVALEHADYARDQKAYLVGVPVGVEVETLTAPVWAAIVALELGPQWALRGGGTTTGGDARILGWAATVRPSVEYRFNDAGIASVQVGVRFAHESWPERSSNGWAFELGARF